LTTYLDQETAKEPFRSSSQAATCFYQSNHSEVEAIPLSAFVAQGHNKRTCRPIFTSHYPFLCWTSSKEAV